MGSRSQILVVATTIPPIFPRSPPGRPGRGRQPVAGAPRRPSRRRSTRLCPSSRSGEVRYVDVKTNKVVILVHETRGGRRPHREPRGWIKSRCACCRPTSSPGLSYDLRGRRRLLHRRHSSLLDRLLRCSTEPRTVSSPPVTAVRRARPPPVRSGRPRRLPGLELPNQRLRLGRRERQLDAQAGGEQRQRRHRARVSARPAVEGASVCRSGATTGWHCGIIQQRDASVTYPQGNVSGLIRTNVCAEPGDSGGSFVSGDQAQGVASGGSGDCSRGITYFQPIGAILTVYGLTLRPPRATLRR